MFDKQQKQQLVREMLQLFVAVVIVGSALAWWLIDYQKPPYHPPLVFPHKWKFWEFFLNNVAFGFGVDKISVFLGTLCLLIIMVPIVGTVIKQRKLTAQQYAVFSIILSLLAVFGSIALSRADFGPAYAKSSRYAEFGMVLILGAVISWSLFLKGHEKLRNSVIGILWMLLFVSFANNWVGLGRFGGPAISFGSYAAVAAGKRAGVECATSYYLQGGEAYCPTIYPGILTAELEQARNLNVSFYRKIAEQYPLRKVLPQHTSLKASTIGIYRPSESTFYLRNKNSTGEPDIIAAFGKQGDVPLAGDWDGNGSSTIGIYRPNQSFFYLRNTNSSGEPDVVVGFGLQGDIPVVGDWDGNGTVTIGVYRPSQSIFFLRNSNSSGEPDLTLSYGLNGDIPLAGDWDGNGTDTIGVYRPSLSLFFLRNANASGEPDLTIGFGVQGDLPVVGDWDGKGKDRIGIYRPRESTFYIRFSNSSEPAGSVVSFGMNSDIPIVGDWDGQ